MVGGGNPAEVPYSGACAETAASEEVLRDFLAKRSVLLVDYTLRRLHSSTKAGMKSGPEITVL